MDEVRWEETEYLGMITYQWSQLHNEFETLLGYMRTHIIKEGRREWGRKNRKQGSRLR